MSYRLSRSGSAVERDPRAGTGLGVVVHECTRLITAYESEAISGNTDRVYTRNSKGEGRRGGGRGGVGGVATWGARPSEPEPRARSVVPHDYASRYTERLTPAFELNRNAPAHIHRMVNCRMSSGLRLVITDSACHRRTRRTENPDTSRLWKQVRSVMRYSAAYLTCSPNTSSGVSEGA